MAENTAETNHLELATELTIAWLSNPNTRASAEEVPSFLATMHGAVTNLSSAAAKSGAEDEAAQPEYTAAVTARKSLSSKDHIISMIDGKPYKTLRRHLARHGLTPEQYRERYGLKSDYPMVAENYAEVRRNLAKKIGLGRKPRGDSAATPPKAATPEPAPKAAAKASDAVAPAKDSPAKSAKPAPAARRKAREAAPSASTAQPAAAKTASTGGAVAKSAKAAPGRKPGAAKSAPKSSPKTGDNGGGSSTPGTAS